MSKRSDLSICVALVDDQTISREALSALIEQEPDLTVVAQSTSVTALEVLEVEPHVVVTDLAQPAEDREHLIGRLRARFRNAAILALTDVDDLQVIHLALAAGVDGYVLKTTAVTDLLAGIRAVASGELYLQPSVAITLAAAKPDDVAILEPAVNGLTPREREVLGLLALGHTNVEIAALLGSSLRTVESHRAHIHQKLDRHTRAELVRFALDIGLLRPTDRSTARRSLRAQT